MEITLRQKGVNDMQAQALTYSSYGSWVNGIISGEDYMSMFIIQIDLSDFNGRFLFLFVKSIYLLKNS